MIERIDHYAAAVSMLKDAEMTKGMDLIAAIVQGAQVHATLALVEQQRIANLIALAQMPGEDDENADYLAGRAMHALIEYKLSEATQFSDADEYPVVQDEIKEALGL